MKSIFKTAFVIILIGVILSFVCYGFWIATINFGIGSSIIILIWIVAMIGSWFCGIIADREENKE